MTVKAKGLRALRREARLTAARNYAPLVYEELIQQLKDNFNQIPYKTGALRDSLVDRKKDKVTRQRVKIVGVWYGHFHYPLPIDANEAAQKAGEKLIRSAGFEVF